MNYFLYSILFLASIFLILTLQKVKRSSFFSDVPYLFPFGVYVWGDGIVLFPFWIVSVLIFLGFQVSEINLYRFVLLFFGFRSFFEVVYWLLLQATRAPYNPPITRRFRMLAAEEGQILYQLAHTCVVVITTFLFMLSVLS